MLFTLQRYEFFSKSQRLSVGCRPTSRCCLPYKGTNFSANHNLSCRESTETADVVYPTKVRIFQQITTMHSQPTCSSSMLFTLQRYEFFSKSQPCPIWIIKSNRCCLPYKGTNFSANHNQFCGAARTGRDVVYPTKVRIFQQITTGGGVRRAAKVMLFTLQRYEFFSKSQHYGNNAFHLKGCCLPYKGTNFSANHNFADSR